MSRIFYNAFGQLESIKLQNSGIENFTQVVKSNKELVDKYSEYTPKNRREKLAVQIERLNSKANKVMLSEEDLKEATNNGLSKEQAREAKYFNFTFPYASKLVNNDINIPMAHVATEHSFKLDEILILKDQIDDAIIAIQVGISKEQIFKSINDKVLLMDILDNRIKKVEIRKKDGLKLQGNLETDGIMRADAFYLNDGTKVNQVPKLALPDNFIM